MGVKDYSYLIIGGTTKAATTSLFFYLSDHPEICAANWKEVRFFLHKEYPLSSKYRFEDGIEKYQEFFSHCSGNKLRMEATPDYLYSKDTAKRIKEYLPKAKIVFILREPISRLISWYKFAKQNNNLPERTTFDEYVRLQLRDDEENKKGQHMLALQHGRYSYYLKDYFDLLRRDRILVVFYETLSSNPTSVLKEICIFSDIKPEFYYNYDFRIFNRAESMKSPIIHNLYRQLRFQVRKYTYNVPYLHSVLKHSRLLIEPLYLKLNTRDRERVVISRDAKKILMDYYRDEAKALKEIINITVPWESV